MWNYILGPIFALLPKWWRESLPFSRSLTWEEAAMVSGLVELFGAIVALGYWYMYSMTAWVNHGVATAMTGKLGAGVRVQEIGAVALSVWLTHSLTLLLAYCMAEGAVRFSAAFTGDVLGTLPLFLCDKILFGAFRHRDAESLQETGSAGGNGSSFVSAIRERMLAAMLPEVRDEICSRMTESEETLEIRASRRKKDWIPPRVVRFEDGYYRLESCSVSAGARPFRYALRRLAAGVPGRTVLVCAPSDAVVRE